MRIVMVGVGGTLGAAVTDAEFADGVGPKLLGRVALARRAMSSLRDGGSITLTGGTFAAPLSGDWLGGR